MPLEDALGVLAGIILSHGIRLKQYHVQFGKALSFARFRTRHGRGHSCVVVGVRRKLNIDETASYIVASKSESLRVAQAWPTRI